MSGGQAVDTGTKLLRSSGGEEGGGDGGEDGDGDAAGGRGSTETLGMGSGGLSIAAMKMPITS